MDENEFEFEDINFISMDANPFFACERCSFHMRPCTKFIKNGDMPPCQDWKRSDGRDVIFVEKK